MQPLCFGGSLDSPENEKARRQRGVREDARGSPATGAAEHPLVPVLSLELLAAPLGAKGSGSTSRRPSFPSPPPKKVRFLIAPSLNGAGARGEALSASPPPAAPAQGQKRSSSGISQLGEHIYEGQRVISLCFTCFQAQKSCCGWRTQCLWIKSEGEGGKPAAVQGLVLAKDPQP